MSLIFDPLPEGTGISFEGPTCLEYALYAYLAEIGVSFIKEWTVPGSRYRLDAYDPINKVGYEADGYPTHFTVKGRLRDKIRDKRILELGSVVEIKRLTYEDLQYWL